MVHFKRGVYAQVCSSCCSCLLLPLLLEASPLLLAVHLPVQACCRPCCCCSSFWPALVPTAATAPSPSPGGASLWARNCSAHRPRVACARGRACARARARASHGVIAPADSRASGAATAAAHSPSGCLCFGATGALLPTPCEHPGPSPLPPHYSWRQRPSLCPTPLLAAPLRPPAQPLYHFCCPGHAVQRPGTLARRLRSSQFRLCMLVPASSKPTNTQLPRPSRECNACGHAHTRADSPSLHPTSCASPLLRPHCAPCALPALHPCLRLPACALPTCALMRPPSPASVHHHPSTQIQPHPLFC